MPFRRAAELEKYVLVDIKRAVGVVINARGAATEADRFHRLSSRRYCSRYLVALSSQ
jgi:hypothetical protein